MSLVWRKKQWVKSLQVWENYAAIMGWDLYQMTSDDTDGTVSWKLGLFLIEC